MKEVNPKKPRVTTDQKRKKGTKTTQRRNIARVVAKFKMGEEGNDFAYWQTRSYEERISTLEELRSSYMRWKYGSIPRLQRVYRIVEQK